MLEESYDPVSTEAVASTTSCIRAIPDYYPRLWQGFKNDLGVGFKDLKLSCSLRCL
jgi:hypothetical protein